MFLRQLAGALSRPGNGSRISYGACLRTIQSCLDASDSWQRPTFTQKESLVADFHTRCSVQAREGVLQRTCAGQGLVADSKSVSLPSAHGIHLPPTPDGRRSNWSNAQADRSDDNNSEELPVGISHYQDKSQRLWGTPSEQRRALQLGTLVKRLPVDADLQVELGKQGHLREDYTAMEINLALRTLTLDDLGQKTTPDWERAILLATWWLEPLWTVSPFPHAALNPLWEMLGRAGRVEQIWGLYDEATKRRGVQFGDQIAGNVVRALFAAGDFEGVVEVYDEALENGWHVRQSDEVIQAQVKAGMLDEAMLTFDRAKSRTEDTPVLFPTYLALLDAGIGTDRLRSRKNDCELARALAARGRTDDALEILRDTVFAMRRGVYFPIFLWLDAIAVAVDMGCEADAAAFQAKGDRSHGFLIAPAFSFYVKKRHVLHSHRTFLALLKLDPEMDVGGTGPALISLLCLERHADEAIEVLDVLIQRGFVPFPKAFGKIIFLLLDEGRWQDAEHVLDTFFSTVMQDQQDRHMGVKVLTAMVRRYVRVKRPEKVMELVKKVRAHKQLVPLSSVYEWVQSLEAVSRRHADELNAYVRNVTKRAQLEDRY